MESEGKSVEKIDLLDGKYEGVWGGYVVMLDNGLQFNVDVGIRCFNCKCIVDVVKGYAYVTLFK